MSKELEKLCGYMKRADDRRSEEEDLGQNIGRSYTTIFSRWGCYECLGYKEKCANYYNGIKVERRSTRE